MSDPDPEVVAELAKSINISASDGGAGMARALISVGILAISKKPDGNFVIEVTPDRFLKLMHGP